MVSEAMLKLLLFTKSKRVLSLGPRTVYLSHLRRIRQQIILNYSALVQSLIFSLLPLPREIWIKPRLVTSFFFASDAINYYHTCRSSRWWEYVVLESFQDHDWKQNFRMSKKTFDYLCNQIRPLLQ